MSPVGEGLKPTPLTPNLGTHPSLTARALFGYGYFLPNTPRKLSSFQGLFCTHAPLPTSPLRPFYLPFSKSER